MPNWTVDLMIKVYGKRVRGIADDYNWETDAFEAMVTRSVLEDDWNELSPEQRQEVLTIDDKPVEQWQRVAWLLPPAGEVARTHWWWFLHEGPQVRLEHRNSAVR